MKIFIKIAAQKPLEVEIEQSDTVAKLLEKIKTDIEAHLDKPISQAELLESCILSMHPNKLLNPDNILADLNIQQYTQLTLLIQPKLVEAQQPSKQILEVFFQTLAQARKHQLNTLIAVGCFDFGHDPETLQRQQYPSNWLTPEQRKAPKQIILIDPEFANPKNSKYKQLYNVDSNWEEEDCNDDCTVRSYFNEKTCDHLLTLACKIPAQEVDYYFGERDKWLANPPTTFLGQPLSIIYPPATQGSQAPTLVIGNFYDDKALPTIDNRLDINSDTAFGYSEQRIMQYQQLMVSPTLTMAQANSQSEADENQQENDDVEPKSTFGA